MIILYISWRRFENNSSQEPPITAVLNFSMYLLSVYAKNISKESLEQKIAKIEKAISKNREQYYRLTAELEELHKKQKAIQSEELLKAIEGSSKSYAEILDFIQGKEKRGE